MQHSFLLFNTFFIILPFQVFLLYEQLLCMKYNAFCCGEIGQMLSKCMNGRWSICGIMNSDLQVSTHTKSHQFPFQECWSIHVIFKLPDATSNHVHCKFKTAYNLSSIQTISWHKYHSAFPLPTFPLVTPWYLQLIKTIIVAEKSDIPILSNLSKLCSSLQRCVR